MRRTVSNVLLGLALIALGLIYGGNVLNLWSFDLSLSGWWTLFIIVPCLHSIIAYGFKSVTVVGLGVGILMLLSEQNILPDNMGYKLIFPLAVVVIGLGIIFKRSVKLPPEFKNGFCSHGNGGNYYAIFGGNRPHFDGMVFTGAASSAIFGGVELFLQNSIINENCVINCNSIFGGTEIRLPSNVRVIVQSTPIFGDTSCKFQSSTATDAPTVLIKAVSIFGGTEIK
ncbi:MAG: hypothetical protein RSF77_05435 [Oscillospiraceae bacterium]